MTKIKRAPARGERMSMRKAWTPKTSSKDPHPQPLPTKLAGRRASARLWGRGGGRRIVAAKSKAKVDAAKSKAPAKIGKVKGGPVPGTPSPMRVKLTPELHDHARRMYETTEEFVCNIALDCGVDESTIRRMATREGWVRFVPPPRDLPPVATLLAQVEELEAAAKGDRHPEVRARSASLEGCTARDSAAVALRGSQVLAPQGDGESAAQDATDNIARFIRVVMAHLDEFEAMRRDGRLLPKHHLTTARAISILTEAFNRLQRLRAAQPGQNHEDTSDMPADLDDYRRELTRQIEQFLQSRFPAGADGEAAAQSAEGV